MAFSQKLISLTVALASNPGTNQPNTFSESGSDSVVIANSRMSVRIQNAGAPADGRAQVKVWGMTPSLMNQLSTLGLVFNLVPKNTLTISAGQADANGNPTNMSIVFSGTIWAAYGDYQAQPNVPFVFECLSGAADAAISVPPSSFQGSSDVATIMSGFARQMNLGFENNGVSLQLTNAYFTGSAKVQATKCAKAADISWGIINGNTLSIWPKGGNRNTPTVPEIGPTPGGTISYPAFTQQGIIVKTLFNPLISFGGLVKVNSTLLSALAAAQSGSSSIVAANSFPSQWAVNKLDLALDTMLPKGQWMSTIFAYNPSYARSIIPPAA